MRVQSLTLALAGAALLAPAPAPAHAPAPSPGPAVRPAAAARPAAPAPAVAPEGDVRAADLLAKVRGCAQISNGRYRSDDGARADIPVCGKRGAVFWKADMDIDCDGRPGRLCNSRTDPVFSDATAYQQSDGRELDAETLPYIVVPGVSDIWNHRDHDVRAGSVAAVIHEDRVQYAVVGDIGPTHIIGEASYATAKALGIRPDPIGGGTDAGVTYLVFKDSRVSPIESLRAAATLGESRARRFLKEN